MFLCAIKTSRVKSPKQYDLKTFFLCRHILPEWNSFLETKKKSIQLKKGKRFIQEGDPVRGIYFVCSGKVKVHKQWGDKELIVRFAHNGAIVGHRGFTTKGSVFPISATTLEPTLLYFIELDLFLATLKVNTEMTHELMLFYADELRESEQKMYNLVHLTVKERLAVALIQLQDQFGTTTSGFINIQLSRQDLAAYLGTTYESLFRMLNELVSEKTITLEGRQIRIENPSALSTLANPHSI